MRHLGHTSIRDTGHAELVEDVAGNWWVFCLGTRHRHYNSASILGRETFLAPLEWSADGWPLVNQNGTIPEHFETNRLPAQAVRTNWRDDFERETLDLAWKHIRNPEEQHYALDTRPGWLRLTGAADNLNAAGAPTFIGRRQEDFEMTFACRLDFEPGEEHEEAGLAVYTNNHHHYRLAVTRRGGQRVALLRRHAGDLAAEGQPLPLDPGSLRLSVMCDGNRYAFFIAAQGQAEQAVGSGLARLLAPEVADNVSVWTGVHLGLYASGNGQTSAAPAYFDWAEYRND
jgi:alpha-N-arabinofuranosidase